MRRIGPIAVAVLVGLVAFLVWWTRPVSPELSPVSGPAQVVVAERPAASTGMNRLSVETAPPQYRTHSKRDGIAARVLPGGTVVVPEFAEAAMRLHASETTGLDDIALLESFIDFYMRANGGAVPKGSENEEIVAVLRGQNAHRLAVIPPDVQGIDDRGRLLDRWGTAYFFHPVSRTVLDVRSAGPDRRLWTEDDLVGRRASEDVTAGL